MKLRNRTNEALWFDLPHDDVCEQVGLCGCTKLGAGELRASTLFVAARSAVEVPPCVRDLRDVKRAVRRHEVTLEGEA
jgi:hypothetical protein